MKVAIADVNHERLNDLAKELIQTLGETNVIAQPTDVSKLDEVVRLRDRVYEAWGEVSVVGSQSHNRGAASHIHLHSSAIAPRSPSFCLPS